MKPETMHAVASMCAAEQDASGAIRNLTEIGKRSKTASQLTVRVGGCSVAGKKPPNQDAFAVYVPKKSGELKHKGVIAAIADGVSTSDVSQKASDLGVTQFIQDYLATPNTWTVKHSVGKVLKSLNHWLYHHGQRLGSAANAMVAAFSGVVIKSNTAHVFHAGDCRVALLRHAHLEPLTSDHRHYHGKSQHHLTRALGIDSHLEIDYKPVLLSQGDLLLLTTDGVHDLVSEKQLEVLLGEHKGKSELELETLAEQVVTLALENGSDDNITCLLVAVDSLPTATFDESVCELAGRVIPPVLREGKKIDHYTVVRVLHSGSRSHIYLARSELDGRQYVLKMPSQNFADDAVYLAGFVREGWIGEQVSQPGVMKIHPPSRYSPFLYHVCDYVEGVTLRQWMIDNPRPSLSQVRTIAEGAIRALRVLQRMSVVHRDIKPDNLMVDADLNVTLIDYGTAQSLGLDETAGLIEEGYPVGDLDYAAPEYLQGQRATVACDIFSLGMTLYELLTGRLPYKPVNAANLRAAVRKDYLPATLLRTDLPDWMDAALKKACQPIASARYQALSEFEQDLKRPNDAFHHAARQLPLIEKNPLAFWKGVSLCLLVIVLLQLGMMVS